MTIFDPYARNQQTVPGLNTGSAMQVSTMTPINTEGPKTNQYRSGALGALAPFLGWCSILLGLAMGFAALSATLLCQDYGMTGAACTADQGPLVVVPIVVPIAGIVLASIGGSLAKRRKAAPSLVVLLAGFLALWAVTQWFSSSVLYLPFP